MRKEESQENDVQDRGRPLNQIGPGRDWAGEFKREAEAWIVSEGIAIAGWQRLIPPIDYTPGPPTLQTEEQYRYYVRDLARYYFQLSVYRRAFGELATDWGNPARCALKKCRRRKLCLGLRPMRWDYPTPFLEFAPPCIPDDEAEIERYRAEIRAAWDRVFQESAA